MMLMMDNLSFHKSGDIQERMDELGFHYTYTPAYSPQYNGIEEVIGIGKRKVKQLRLERILKDEPVDLENIIRGAFNGIDIQQVAKCIARSLQLLNLHQ